jgi:hypothetical protein
MLCSWKRENEQLAPLARPEMLGARTGMGIQASPDSHVSLLT